MALLVLLAVNQQVCKTAACAHALSHSKAQRKNSVQDLDSGSGPSRLLSCCMLSSHLVGSKNLGIC